MRLPLLLLLLVVCLRLDVAFRLVLLLGRGLRACLLLLLVMLVRPPPLLLLLLPLLLELLLVQLLLQHVLVRRLHDLRHRHGPPTRQLRGAGAAPAGAPGPVRVGAVLQVVRHLAQLSVSLHRHSTGRRPRPQHHITHQCRVCETRHLQEAATSDRKHRTLHVGVPNTPCQRRPATKPTSLLLLLYVTPPPPGAIALPRVTKPPTRQIKPQHHLHVPCCQ